MEDGLNVHSPNDQPFEFRLSHVKSHSYHSVSTLSLIGIFVGVLQLFYAFLTVDSYFVLNLLAGSLVFITSILIRVWSKSTGDEFDSELSDHKKKTHISTNFIFIFVCIATALFITSWTQFKIRQTYPNDIINSKSYTAQWWHEHAGVKETSQVLKAESWFHWFYSWTNWFVLVLFLYTLRTSYRNLDDDEEAASNLLLISAVAASSFAFTAMWFSHSINNLPSFPAWITEWIFALGIVIVVLSFISWLYHLKHWRPVNHLTWFLLVVTLFLGVALTGRAAQGTLDVYNGSSKQTSGLPLRFAAVHEDELKAYGCPSKYAQYNCPNSESIAHWEANVELRRPNALCLDMACQGTMGQLYAELPLIVTAAFLTANSFVVILIGSLSYFMVHGFTVQPHGDGEAVKVPVKTWIALGLWLVSVIVFVSLFFALDRVAIREYKGDVSQLFYDNLYS